MAKVWKISSVEYKTTGTNGANEIDVVHFTVTDTVDGVTKTRHDFHHLNPATDKSKYQKMEDVTEEQLITWVKATMGSARAAWQEWKLYQEIAAEKKSSKDKKKREEANR